MGRRLPQVRALAEGIRELGVGATLRGVEAQVEGWLVREEGELRLIVSGTGEVVRLAPLIGLVQWNVESKREQLPSEAERLAYARLAGRFRRQFQPAYVLGPIREPENGGQPVLEVREFGLGR